MSTHDPFALGGRQDDPLPGLWRRHQELCQALTAAVDADFLAGGSGQGVAVPEEAELRAIEARISNTVALTYAGVTAQALLLGYWRQAGTWNAHCDRLVENIGHAAWNLGELF